MAATILLSGWYDLCHPRTLFISVKYTETVNISVNMPVQPNWLIFNCSLCCRSPEHKHGLKYFCFKTILL